MNLLSVYQASKEVAGELLYKDVTFGIDEGDKIAIIGVNGSGKSTLIKILAGLDQFDSGRLTTNNSLKIGYLEQKIDFEPDQTIRDFIFASDNERVRVVKEHLEVEQLLSGTPDGVGKGGEHPDTRLDPARLEHIQEKMETLDGWKLEGEAREILFQLNLDDINIEMKSLSGGMIKKVALARLFIEDNNLIFLDEPTNHLDLSSIVWLENHLATMKKALVMITHDRYFLDNVADHILEIDSRHINKYPGHYSLYLEKKEELALIEKRTLDKHQKILTEELKWLNRMPKARGTKAKSRKQSIEARHTIVVQNSQKEGSIDPFYSNQSRLGKRILEAVNISKSFAKGDQKELIFSEFSHEFSKNEKIALIGENGAGKTTFLKVLMQQIEPDTGKAVHGVNTKIGYLSQHPPEVAPELSLVQSVREIANYIEYEDGQKITATELLDRFLFSGRHHQKVSSLSGGERRRLDIIRILITNPNFLILDEPTNDLDLQTLSILEDYLATFPGCLLVVSHDRYFLDKLASSVFIFQKGQPIDAKVGRPSDFISARQRPSKADKKGLNKASENDTTDTAGTDQYGSTDSPGKPQREKKKTKLSNKEIRRKAEIEELIPQLEKEIKELEKNLSSGESNPELLKKWSTEYPEKEQLLFEVLAELEEIESSIG